MYFETYTHPEAEILGIRSFFGELSVSFAFPWKEAREPTIEVSGINDRNTLIHRLG